ncbi:MAG: nucleotidyl transferase AbiEii/AbiGii toxin family protein [Gallionella sp.]
MTDTSLDFSAKTELRWLSELVLLVQQAAGELPYFIAGATARDLILQYGYGIDTARRTYDVDFAFMVETWFAFEALRSKLLATGKFTAAAGNAHRLQFDGGMAVDLVPFGAIERSDRTIAWAPDGAVVMSVFGFREALASTILVVLPGGVTAPVVSLPALALLKITAWMERRYDQPGKDAYDLLLILQNYLDAGNHDRLYTDAAHLLERGDFDYEAAGAWLLGHDMGKLLVGDSKAKVAALLERESNLHGPLRLVGDMRAAPETLLALLSALKNGFTGN